MVLIEILIEFLLTIISKFIMCIIAEIFGIYTRYFLFFLIGKRKTIKYLSRDTYFNVIVGFISFCFAAIGIAYLVSFLTIIK